MTNRKSEGKLYPKISELNDEQKGHLAWRLDHKTCCGMLTAMRIARGEYYPEDISIVEVFKRVDKTERSAKIHARKVMNFSLARAYTKLNTRTERREG